MRKPVFGVSYQVKHKQLICAFVFAYIKSRFSHDAAHLSDWLCFSIPTRFDVYETLCPQQMLVHKGGQIKNWGGECRDVTPAVSKYSKSTAGILP